MTQIGVLVGNPRPASRTLQAALALREALASTLGVPVEGPVVDQAPSGWLRGKIVVPLQIAASDRHALAVEVHLRPVLTELGALVPQALFLNEASLPADATDFELDADVVKALVIR